MTTARRAFSAVRLWGILALFAAVAAVLAILVVFLAGRGSAAGDVYVDASNTGDPLEDGSPGHPFDEIQEGVDAALPGDTVHVAVGTYYEHVTIGKSLALQGEDRDTTIIDGGGSGNVVHITADNLQMSAFTITNGYNGIFLDAANSNTISDVKVISQTSVGGNTGLGIWFDHGASSNTIAGSEVAYSDLLGIHLMDWDGQRNNTIIDCNVHHNGVDGINGYITTDGTQVIRCDVHHNGRIGIRVGWSSWTIRDSNVYANGTSGILLDTARYTVIEDNNIHSNTTAVALAGIPSRHNTVRRNNICWNSSWGATAQGPDYPAHDNAVYHNNFIENGTPPQAWDAGTNNA